MKKLMPEVQAELDREAREQITGEMSGYPPEGEYEFVGYSRYYPSTPWGGEDYESGLELIT